MNFPLNSNAKTVEEHINIKQEMIIILIFIITAKYILLNCLKNGI